MLGGFPPFILWVFSACSALSDAAAGRCFMFLEQNTQLRVPMPCADMPQSTGIYSAFASSVLFTACRCLTIQALPVARVGANRKNKNISVFAASSEPFSGSCLTSLSRTNLLLHLEQALHKSLSQK